MKMIESRLEQRGQGGFTLIELLVVIAILAVLGGAVIIGIGALRGNAEEEVCQTNRETIETAGEARKTAENAATYVDTATLVSEGYIKANTIPAGQTWTVDGTTGEANITAGLDAAVMTACNA